MVFYYRLAAIRSVHSGYLIDKSLVGAELALPLQIQSEDATLNLLPRKFTSQHRGVKSCSISIISKHL